MTDEKVAVVIGVGPGLGAAVSRRFAREGYAIGLVSRTRASSEPVQAAIEAGGGRATSIAGDAADELSLATAIAEVKATLGAPEVLVYNAGAFRMGGVLEVSADELAACWRANCLGGYVAAQRVLPDMLAKRRGTLLFTGATASLRGSARFAALAAGKFGLRAVAQSLARELGPQGIHVAHVIIDGQIDLPRSRATSPQRGDETFLSPDAIAETYWQLHVQHPTAWTHELDVRPAVEKF